MTELLEVPEIRRQAFAGPVEAYHRLTEGLRTELLRGTIIEKMSKSPRHYSFVDNFRDILTGQIKPGWVLRQEGPLTFADSEPEPDLCVVRGKKADFTSHHPSAAEWVIEIAVSSLEIDRVKAHIYAEAGVREYWIVCPEKKQVEVYRGPGAEGYAECTVVASPAVLGCAALPGVAVDLAALFA